MSRPLIGLVLVLFSIAVGCRAMRERRPAEDTSQRPLEPTFISYVDAEGFDLLFESALVNRDPAIIIRTENEKPDWKGRLNAWIAAWNKGGQSERRIVRGQIPVPSVNADTLREFRLLVFGVVDRAEELAKAGGAWWQEERVVAKRVALLRPYNLRFHITEENQINLIFFNGDYPAYYHDYVKSLTGSDEKEWSRSIECSACKKFLEASRMRRLPFDGE